MSKFKVITYDGQGGSKEYNFEELAEAYNAYTLLAENGVFVTLKVLRPENAKNSDPYEIALQSRSDE